MGKAIKKKNGHSKRFLKSISLYECPSKIQIGELNNKATASLIFPNIQIIYCCIR
jgi:hypothetical protein